MYKLLTDTRMWKLGLRLRNSFLGIFFVANFQYCVFAVWITIPVPLTLPLNVGLTTAWAQLPRNFVLTVMSFCTTVISWQFIFVGKTGHLLENSPYAAQWTYSEVPFVLDPTFSRSDRALIIAVCKLVSCPTCSCPIHCIEHRVKEEIKYFVKTVTSKWIN